MIKNILKLLRNYKTMLVIWFLYLITPLIDSVYLLIKSKQLLNGTIFNHLIWIIKNFYAPSLLFVFCLIMYLWYSDLIKFKKINYDYIRVIKLISLTSLLELILINFLVSIESVKYPNYLYSKFGIKVNTLNAISIINILIIISTVFLINIFKLNTKNEFKLPTLNIQKLKVFLIYVSVTIILLFSTYPFINILKIHNEIFQNYNSRLGPTYKYIDLLIKYTPEDQKIIHPPQSQEWPLVGNQPLIRYFLFPRVLISGAILDNKDIASEIGVAYFFRIPKTINSIEWPVVEFEKNKISFDNSNMIEFAEINRIVSIDGVEIYKIKFK